MPLATAIFLGAFLLFQVQPLIARYILPWFGGSPAVWTTAMLFFQVMLLAGYAYTHFIVGRLTLRRQVTVHLILLLLTLSLMPITPQESMKPDGSIAPQGAILLLLLFSVGMPYLLIASTAPLLQSWYTKLRPGRSPYGLYAISNTGSVLGLLTYPLLVEPLLGSLSQTIVWSFGYGTFIAIIAWAVIPVYRLAPETLDTQTSRSTTQTRTSLADQTLWLALSACGVVVLLAATNQLCKDVAVIPLLWVLPLTLYLLSFVISFGFPSLYFRPLWATLLLVSVTAVLWLLLQDNVQGSLSLYSQIFIYSAVVFTCSIVCHGELFRLRPNDNQLTLFYLMLSIGGALGGVFVNLIAPLIFSGYWEFHLSLVATFILLGFCVTNDESLASKMWLTPAMVVGWVAIGGLSFLLTSHIESKGHDTLVAHRSFYGILRVQDTPAMSGLQIRDLMHGRINHGSQILEKSLGGRPISYYGPDSGIGIAVETSRQIASDASSTAPLRIGVVGQGASTIAAFGKTGDLIRFYEIDPVVSEIAETYFTYLSESQANTEVIIGDARITMEAELAAGQYQEYDILAVDAFSGDGIPVHLLTREALALYRQHLTPHGVIAVHISNKYFDLRPVVRLLADTAGLHSAWIEDLGMRVGESENDWVLLTHNSELYERLLVRAKQWPQRDDKPTLWTDDYANLLEVIWHR